MRHKFNFSSSMLDTGSGAPTFVFKMGDFFKNAPDSTNNWQTVETHYKKQNKLFTSRDALFKLLIRDKQELLQQYAFEAVLEKHRQFFPEEDAIDELRTICSKEFESTEKDAKHWQIGDAHDVENVFHQYDAGLFNTPTEALDFAAGEIAKNIFRRLHDSEKPLAGMLVQAYLGTSMPLTISARMIITHKLTGVRPTDNELRKQGKRNADHWKCETLEQVLDAISKSDMPPDIKVLAIAGAYQKNKIYFGNDDTDSVLGEAVAGIEFNDSYPEVPGSTPS